MLDYRFRSFYDDVTRFQATACATADKGKKARETEAGANEVEIARHEGRSEAYKWIADQLKMLESELPPTAGAQPVTPEEAKTTSRNSNGRRLRSSLRNVREYIDQAQYNGRNYGWSDAKYCLDNALESLSQADGYATDVE